MWDAAVPYHERLKVAMDYSWAPPGMDPAEFDEAARAKYAATMSSIYQKTVQSILVHQEGERRAHGFDYRIQQKGNDGTDHTAVRNELLEEFRAVIRGDEDEPKVIEGRVVDDD